MNNYNNSWYPNPEREKIRARNFFRRNLWAVISTGVAIVAIVALILVLTRPAASTNSTPQPSSQSSSTTAPSATTVSTSAAATPTTVVSTVISAVSYPPGQLIYQATDWSTWQGSAEWKVVDANTYGSDGTDDGSSGKQYTAWAPGLNLPQNYAIEATITFARSTTNNYGDHEVDLLGRGDGSSNGYGAGAYAFSCGNVCDNEAAISLIGTGNTVLSKSGYTLDNKPHTFRVEFRGNSIKFFIDGSPYTSTTDNTYIQPGRVGLRAYDADINVTSFKVFAL